MTARGPAGNNREMGLFSKTIEEESDERGKVFAWANDHRVWMHLSAFLLFSVIIHGAGFYLFKVVYPAPVRVEPEPDAIQVMEPGDPAARAVLQRLGDRAIYLLPPSTQAEVRLRLESIQVHFTPAFQKSEPAALPPPCLEKGPGPVTPLPLEAGVPGRSSGRVFVKIDPGLAGRPLAPWSVLHDYLGLAESIPTARFTLEIAPGGEVTVTGVEGELGDGERAELAGAVESTLRFVPAEGKAAGWIELAVGVDPGA